MAEVPLKDHCSRTDDIMGYAHIHSDPQNASEELKSSFFPSERQARWDKGTRGKHKSTQLMGSRRLPRHMRAKVVTAEQRLEASVVHMGHIMTSDHILWEQFTRRVALQDQEPPPWLCHKPANCAQVICWLQKDNESGEFNAFFLTSNVCHTSRGWPASTQISNMSITTDNIFPNVACVVSVKRNLKVLSDLLQK